MSKNNQGAQDNATVTREILLEALKASYISNEGMGLIHDSLESEGLEREEYTEEDLLNLYNHLATTVGSTTSAVYNSPQLVIQGKTLTQTQVANGFEDMARAYIKEYVALQTLLKMKEVDLDTLLIQFNEKVTFSQCLDALSQEIMQHNLNPQANFTFHFQTFGDENKASARGDNEEKRAPAVEQNYAQPQGGDPVVIMIKSMKGQGKNNEEIIENILSTFPDSPTVTNIYHLQVNQNVSLEEIFHNYCSESDSGAAPAVIGSSRGDREEKWAISAEDNHALQQGGDPVVASINSMKAENKTNDEIYTHIVTSFPNSPIVKTMIEFRSFGATVLDVLLPHFNKSADASPAGQGSSRGDREEKGAPAVEQNHAQSTLEAQVVSMIKSLQNGQVNNDKILDRLNELFPESKTLATIIEFKNYGLSLSQIFGNLTINLGDAAPVVLGTSRADREEKGAPASVGQNHAQSKEQDQVVATIKRMKESNAVDDLILRTIKIKFPEAETTTTVKALLMSGSTLAQAFETVLAAEDVQAEDGLELAGNLEITNNLD